MISAEIDQMLGALRSRDDKLCLDAAAQIERLLTTLRNIVAIDEHRSGDLRDAFDMAREALKD